MIDFQIMHPRYSDEGLLEILPCVKMLSCLRFYTTFCVWRCLVACPSTPHSSHFWALLVSFFHLCYHYDFIYVITTTQVNPFCQYDTSAGLFFPYVATSQNVPYATCYFIDYVHTAYYWNTFILLLFMAYFLSLSFLIARDELSHSLFLTLLVLQLKHVEINK